MPLINRREAVQALGATAAAQALAAETPDICFLSAVEMADLIRRKRLSAREVLAAHLKQIGPVNPKVNANCLDWSQCPAVESIPGKLNAAWVLRGTRTPVKVLFENLEAGMSIEEVMEQFPVTREQIDSLMAFVAR